MVGNIFNIRISYILAIGSITMIYFQLYWHYWFVRLIGGYVVNTLLPIMLLFSVFIIREFATNYPCTIKKRKIYYLFTFLFGYLFFAAFSIFINEQGFESIKRYLIYIYSPILIYISILGLS